MNVLVIAPHPDDESIGCGGALALHADRGDRVTVVFLTSGELGLKQLPRDEAWAMREQEAHAAAEILGVASLVFLRQPDWYVQTAISKAAEKLREILLEETPQVVYLPHTGESHPDHGASAAVLRQAWGRQFGELPELLEYEVWTPLSMPNKLIDISSVFGRKRRAIQCHASQLQQFRYDRAVQGLNRFRGEMGANCAYAEAFWRTSAEQFWGGGLPRPS